MDAWQQTRVLFVFVLGDLCCGRMDRPVPVWASLYSENKYSHISLPVNNGNMKLITVTRGGNKSIKVLLKIKKRHDYITNLRGTVSC